MDKPCIIQADFSTFRPVSGRKVLQLTFEVPIEQTRDVLEKLGIPTPGENRWCAIALLKPEAEGQAPEGGGSPKSSKPFSSLPLSQQAGIRCNDQMFSKFMWASHPGLMSDAGDVVKGVHEYCGVASRSELDNGLNTRARKEWFALEHGFQTWLTDQKYAGSRR